MDCLCALTFVVFLGFNNVAIDYVYGLPLHCVQGTFHYDPHEDALVFRRRHHQVEERVSIKLPHPDIQGTFQVFYCWGHVTAIVGNTEVGVIIQRTEKGLA